MTFLRTLALLLLVTCPAVAQQGTRDVMVVFDMSGSMWGQVDGTAKVEIARDAFGALLSDWGADDVRTGLVVYGHRRRGDCADIELLSRPGDGADIGGLVAGLSPVGKTPLSDAVREAAEVLRYTEEAATVVLLSDGIETCDADPCAVGAELETLGLDFTAHVIGFDIAEGDRAQLRCLADATGGKYFDAADAAGLADAMRGVATATAQATPGPAAEPEALTRTVTVRLKGPMGLQVPRETTVFADGVEVGRLPRGDAVIPGLVVDLAVGPVTLTAEGPGATGTLALDVTARTGVVDLPLVPAADAYVLWQDSPLPINGSHVVMLKNRTGADRGSHHFVLLYPQGATGPDAAIGRGMVGPTSGVFHAVTIPSPATPGDYELAPTGTDGTEYGRVPIRFAAEVTPEWLGSRTVEPGGILDARWQGDANRSTAFTFSRDGKRDSSFVVEGIRSEDGFRLPAPSAPGLYDLSLRWRDAGNARVEASLGQIAVGVALDETEPAAGDQIEAAPDGAVPGDAIGDPDAAGLAREAEAMGGEEFATIPAGDLHGDWLLVAVDHDNRPLFATQIVHDAGAATASGDVDIRADGWALGETTGHERFDVMRRGDAMLFTAHLSDRTYGGRLEWDGRAWRGEMDYDGDGIDRLDVALVRPVDPDRGRDLVPTEAATLPPVPGTFIATDERGQRITTPTDWLIVEGDAQDGEAVRTDEGKHYVEALVPGAYAFTASAGGLTGSARAEHGPETRRTHFVVLRPPGEGADLPIETVFYCSPGEECDMEMVDVPITFTLPEGWGAERPLEARSGKTSFNMVRLTPDGPFWATLNLRQRMAELGPCREVLQGTFCHDATDDPDLLAEVETIARSLSYKPAGSMMLIGDAADDLVRRLGATE